MEGKVEQPLWKAAWRLLKKLKLELSYDPAITLLGIYMKKTSLLIKKIYVLCIPAVFTISKIQKPKLHAYKQMNRKR